ncbi:MAG: hypothetical protein A2041_06405 [Bacteroidetes bacterium GWA2_31_9b]|nr:MAG: hypothetical protein A2041_06405 [Bacteroidetes bacterium GWA2_31_9b]
MKMKRWFLIVFAFLTTCIYAQDVTFNVLAPKVVEVGQQFRLIFSVNAQAEGFTPPNIQDFAILAGPSTSTSSNVSIMNGKVTQNYELKYSYILEATKEGQFTIPSAEIVVNKKKYVSNSFTIEVIKGSGNKTAPTTNQTNQQQNESVNTANVSSSDHYLKVIVSKTKVRREEHFIATVKLYSRLGITNFGEYKVPSFDGFITERIDIPPLSQLSQENVNGQIFYTGIIDKYILYPQKTGEIVINPFELNCYYQIQSRKRSGSIFDEFFGTYERAQAKALSLPVTIKVEAIPENKPESFAGAIGEFKMDASLDKSQIKTNEAVTLKIKIAGNGNLKYITSPKIEFPSDFDVYDPKISDNIKYSEIGATGNKTFEYLIIPRHPGNFNIPKFEFSYFDTRTNNYKVLSAGDYQIIVDKSLSDTSITVTNSFNKEDIKFLGKDIRFIKKGESNLKEKGLFLFGSGKFYLYYIIIILLFGVYVFIRKKNIQENANIQLVRNKKANTFARKRLQKASLFMKQNQKEEFYEELVRALWGYISDKLSIPAANLSKDNARSRLQSKNVNSESIEQIINIIDRCEYARYAPVSENTQMDVLFNDSVDIISKLQQQLK